TRLAHRCEHLCHFGLADTRIAFEQQWPLQVLHQQQRGDELRLGNVSGAREILLPGREFLRAPGRHARLAPKSARNQSFRIAQANAKPLSCVVDAVATAGAEEGLAVADCCGGGAAADCACIACTLFAKLAANCLSTWSATDPIMRPPNAAALPLIETS